VEVVSCHTGWTSASSHHQQLVDEGNIRTPWQAAEGVIWLLAVADSQEIETGGFYLDRALCCKHLAGPFFTEGSYTTNSKDEVDEMILSLEMWADANTRPSVNDCKVAIARRFPLVASTESAIDIPSFLGKWFVLANIPTIFEVGASNCTESYEWNEEKNQIDVIFSYVSAGSSTQQVSQTIMKAIIINSPNNSHWLISPKIGYFYLPFRLDYLIIDSGDVIVGDEEEDIISYVTVGVPDRSNIWIMTREKPSNYQAKKNLAENNVNKLYDLSFGNKTRKSSSFVDIKRDIDIKKQPYHKRESSTRDKQEMINIDDKTRLFNREKLVLQVAVQQAIELGYDSDQILRVSWTS
jgi:lipocalin